MANRKNDRAAKRSTSSTRGGVARRGAFGDEPRAGAGPASASARREYTGPSSQPVSEGLEGAIFSDADDTDDTARERTSGRESGTARRRNTSTSRTTKRTGTSTGRGRNTRRS